MESSTYHTMQTAKPCTCHTARKTTHTNRKKKRSLLCDHDKSLNFSENIGISDTSSHEERHTIANNANG